MGPALNPLSPSPWWSELDNLGAAFPSNLSRSLSAHCPFSSPGAAPLALKRRDGSEPTNPQEGPEVPSWLSPAHLTDWGSSLRLRLSIPPHVRLLPTALNAEPAHPSPCPSAPRGTPSLPIPPHVRLLPVALNAEPAKLPLGQRVGRDGAFLCYPDKRAPIQSLSIAFLILLSAATFVCLNNPSHSLLLSSHPLPCPVLILLISRASAFRGRGDVW